MAASGQALLLASILVLAMAVGHSSASWCVCKPGSDAVLQKSLDYACGHGADCNPIKPNGACYNPSSVVAHCSYAVNSYYQKMSSTGATCDFGSTAYLTNTDPSVSGCSYPASASAAGSSSTTPTTTVPSTTPTGTTPTTTVPSTTPTGTTPVGTTPISGTTPTTASPYTTTPTGVTPSSSGILGGVGTGLAPTGMDDSNNAGMTRQDITSVALCTVLAGLVLHLRN